MEKVILELKNMYSQFNIAYETPVYDFALPPHPKLIDRIFPLDCQTVASDENTTGNYLFRLGILPQRNIKGSHLDHAMQPRCLQFVLHHIYLFWYFMPRHDYSEFEKVTLSFFKEEISDFVQLLKRDSEAVKALIRN